MCGLGQIIDPVPPETLYKGYNYCFSAWKPEAHRATELDMIDSHKPGGSVFEIGCNDGLFLEELKQRGDHLCVGLEPNIFAREIAVNKRGIGQVYETFLNEETCRDAVSKHGRFDVVVSRQVLEHVADINLFFRCVDLLLKEDGILFIDVPDIGGGLAVGDCTIAWEEHVNYFTDQVLVNLLDRQGFTSLDERKFNYSGGTLAVLSKRKQPGHVFQPSREHLPLLATFNERVKAYGSKLAQALKKARANYDQIVIYGVGCRACALVNGHALGGLIDFAVDDQPERQGKLLPGSQLEIKSPSVLQTVGMKSLIILAVNQENEEKVATKTQAACSASEVSFLVVMGPTDIQKELDAFAGA
jgi:SAM-dependent methyltransferase